jgi:hypothetical protein
VLYVFAYSALGVSGYSWYYAPLVPGFLAASGLGSEALVSRLTLIPKLSWGGLAVGSVVVLGLAVVQDRVLLQTCQQPDTRFLFVLPACFTQQTFAGEAYNYSGELVIYRCNWKRKGSP